MMKVVVSGYECWVRGKDVVVVADFVENAVFTFRGVIFFFFFYVYCLRGSSL